MWRLYTTQADGATTGTAMSSAIKINKELEDYWRQADVVSHNAGMKSHTLARTLIATLHSTAIVMKEEK
jgi:hypothetical protein